MFYISKIIYFLLVVLQLVMIYYLLNPFILVLVYLLKKKKSHLHFHTNQSFRFAAIITAHRDHRFIAPLVDSLVKQTYSNIIIYVVADDCDVTSLHFADPRVILLRPEKPLNAKIKSIHYAIENFKDNPDAVAIFDSDNLVHPEYFSVVNQYFNSGYRVVQTNMQPKNLDNTYSRLDAAYDMYHNFVDREVRMMMGLSANIWGLGIVIDTKLYKEVVYEHSLGGFDKKLQMDIVKKTKIAFAKEALVFDEKVTDGKALETQRSRWIFAYLKHVKNAWHLLLTGCKSGKFDLIYFGFNLISPPIVFQMLFCFLMILANWLLNPLFSVIWMVAAFLYIVSFVVIIAIKDKKKQILYSLPYLPVFLYRLLKVMLKIKAASKSFLKTEHNRIIYIDELLEK